MSIILKMEENDQDELSPVHNNEIEDSMDASMVLKQWSDVALEELINAYEPHTCLWITTSDEYKDPDKKETALQEVDRTMQQFHFSRQEYTKKWTILRGQFLREVRRERSSNHVPGWRWYPKLEFLKKDEILFDRRVKSKTETINAYSLPRKRNHVTVELTPSPPVAVATPFVPPPLPPQNKHPRRPQFQIAVSPHHQHHKQKHTQQSHHQQQQQIVHQKSHEDIVIEYINPPFITTERKDESSNNTSNSNRMVQTNAEQSSNGTTLPSTDVEDQESLFGKMVATTLRKFSPYQRVLARKQIQDLLFEIELQNASNTT
ncbi:uncharacterized protein [Clytia hemisphaerica]|uniref:MADF domain-containing protein n=1 Tax=Clytia hemisphaerica TaxID=252671 RepID=A0A7M5TYX6_9CNID